MLLSQTFEFLSELKKNNNRDWFTEKKNQYLSAKAEFESFIGDILLVSAQFDKSLAGIDVSKCVFRIYRDIRFSKDKTPYKTHFGAFMSRDGRKGKYAGYYIHLDPGGSFIAGGVYKPDKDVLKSVRSEIYYNLSEFESILNEKRFKDIYAGLDGEKLVRPPKGIRVNLTHNTKIINW
ncbi:MAG: DUF2461 domain-containing protein [Bacteroidales bacterium]|nr:DUF2461 domain-containing protein [Bacteroidales bacterium]